MSAHALLAIRREPMREELVDELAKIEDRIIERGEHGRHRAIRNHAFVQRWGDDKYGCGRPEDDEPHVICGYYRDKHLTMAQQS